jgi:hypothetical protein
MVAGSYHCPRCGAVAELRRGAYLRDSCVTPDPLEGWSYVAAHEAVETDRDAAVEARADSGEDPNAEADGVEIVRGVAETDGEGCGEPSYLSVVRFEKGRELDPRAPVADARFDVRR